MPRGEARIGTPRTRLALERPGAAWAEVLRGVLGDGAGEVLQLPPQAVGKLELGREGRVLPRNS